MSSVTRLSHANPNGLTAWIISTATPPGRRDASPRASQSTCAPEPQKPSTPWVALTITSADGAARGPNQETSVVSGFPSGPRSGWVTLSSAPPASRAAARNLVRAAL